MNRSAALPILLFSAAAALATWFAVYLSERPFGWPYVVVLGYFAVISLLLHAWQEKSAGEVKVFMRRFMTGLVVKLMLSVVVLVILLVTAPDGYRKPMSIAFVLLYLAFLGFSTGRLVMLIRKGDSAAP